MSTIISGFATIQIDYHLLNDPGGPEILAKRNITRSRKSRLFHNFSLYLFMFFPSRVDTTHPGIVGNAVDSQHIGRGPRVH